MLIQSIIERDGGSVITLGNTEYHFTPGQDGKHVCEVTDNAHIARFLSISEGFCIPGTAPREEHKPAHAPVEPVAAPVAAKRTLNFPDTFTIGGEAVALTQVVEQVMLAEDLTADQWALLSDDEQAAKIEARLDLLADEAEAREMAELANPPQVDPADTNGDGVVDDKEERAALVAQHQALFGSKPHHKWSVQKIRDAIANHKPEQAQ